MKEKLAGIYRLNGVAATITKQMLHDFNLKKQEITNLKRKVSYAEMLVKLMYSRMDILRSEYEALGRIQV